MASLLSKLQNLDRLQPIVDTFGIPTQYFIRFIQNRRGALTDVDALLVLIEETVQDIADVDIIAGTALDGGGNIGAGADITIDHADQFLGTPGSYGDASNVAQFTVDAQGHITAAANVPIAGGGGGAWTVAASGTISSGVAQVDVPNLTFTDALIIARGFTFATASNFIAIRVSVNNGSSFYAASGDYISVSAANGSVTNQAEAGSMQNSVTTNSPKSGALTIQGNGLASPPLIDETTTTSRDKRFFVASTSAIDALRIYAGNGGNLTAGNWWVLTR